MAKKKLRKRSNRRKRQQEIPTSLVVAVVLIGAIAVSFPMYLAGLIFGFNVAGSGSIAGFQFRGATPSEAVPNVVCDDKDGGVNLETASECIDFIGKHSDATVDGKVQEWGCYSNTCKSSLYSCAPTQASVNGACV